MAQPSWLITNPSHSDIPAWLGGVTHELVTFPGVDFVLANWSATPDSERLFIAAMRIPAILRLDKRFLESVNSPYLDWGGLEFEFFVTTPSQLANTQVFPAIYVGRNDNFIIFFGPSEILRMCDRDFSYPSFVPDSSCPPGSIGAILSSVDNRNIIWDTLGLSFLQGIGFLDIVRLTVDPAFKGWEPWEHTAITEQGEIEISFDNGQIADLL